MENGCSLGNIAAIMAAADLGGFRAAADSLHLSASALSRRIEKLEDALGVRLFERTTRKMDLTIVGRGFLDRAYLILNEIDNSMLEVDDFARNMTGELTIACRSSERRVGKDGF
ncbi:LysR family transcriptional regulator [Burkholderia gladioli]|uniref:LysR family transcriptional regulator n=1 Tax=Burkholderia gladioli TaxID=28095 RepID=UPI001FC7CF85|nr:LysR family transcriptional regulator [Burkholderia gladioli]